MVPRSIFLLGLVSINGVLARPTARALSSPNPDLQVCFDYVQAILEGSYNPPDPQPCIRYLDFIWLASFLFDCGPGDWFNVDIWSCDTAAIGTNTTAGGNGTTSGSNATTTPRKRQEQPTDLATAYQTNIIDHDGITIPLAIITMWLKATGVSFFEDVWGCLFAQAFQDPDVKNLPLNSTSASLTNSTSVRLGR